MLRAKRSYGSVLCGALAACALLLVVFASPASADLTYGVGWSGDYAGTENEMNEIAHSGATISPSIRPLTLQRQQLGTV